MRILIVKTSSMGDLLHALPTVRNLKVRTGARIDWVVSNHYAELAACFSDVDRVIPFYRKEFFSTFKSFIRDLRLNEYDHIIDLQGLFKSALVTRLARGKRRIGPSFYREGARVFYDSVAGKRDKNRHAVEECLDVIGHLGLEKCPVEFPITVPEYEPAGAPPRVALLPQSRWPSKNWPFHCFADVAVRLKRAGNATIFLLGGADSSKECDAIEKALAGDAINLAGKTSLPEMGGVLKEMDLLISNDSGPVHLSAALGVPTVVIFGPTDPKRTGPYGERHRIISEALPCQPCFSRNCRREGTPCLSGITPERVSEAALDLLRQKR